MIEIKKIILCSFALLIYSYGSANDSKNDSKGKLKKSKTNLCKIVSQIPYALPAAIYASSQGNTENAYEYIRKHSTWKDSK